MARLATPETMTSMVKLTSGIGQRYLLDGSSAAATVDTVTVNTAAEHPGRVEVVTDRAVSASTSLGDEPAELEQALLQWAGVPAGTRQASAR